MIHSAKRELHNHSKRGVVSIPLKLAIFTFAGLAITWLSRRSLRSIRSHGFYRFFAWMTILALILLNVDFWFQTPFKLHQLLSWFLLLSSLLLVIPGVRLLREIGKPDDERADPSLLGMEKTSELVTVGIYQYIRHPLYSSLLFLAWGAFFKHVSWEGEALAVLSSIFLTTTARIEETENLDYFGDEYRDYMDRTKMFVPYLF